METARLWRSLGHHDADGRFRIDGVTGPDEYSAIADNNVYTNLMAQRNLRRRRRASSAIPDEAAGLGVDEEEIGRVARRRRSACRPLRRRSGSTRRRGLHRARAWDFARTPPDQYPLLLHFPYFDLYRKQVVKQADLVLAMQLCGEAFTAEEKARNFAYYERITVRDSSLSACTQAVIAAEVGHLDLAYDYLARGGADRPGRPRAQHPRRPAHRLASPGRGRLVAGFGGMRDHGGEHRLRARGWRRSWNESRLSPALPGTAGPGRGHTLRGPLRATGGR